MKRTEKAELISVICSAFLAAGMITVAFITHSISILAEGTDTVIDVVASVAVLAGLRLSARKTRAFPSGLYKLENLIATGIGILILFSAYELARESIERIVSGETPLEDAWLVMLVMSVTVVVTGFIAWYKGKVGREENSPSLRADARHSVTDLIASAAIIVGIGLEMAGVKHMDSAAALVVVAFLGWSGIEVTLGGLKVLLDASIEREVREQARSIAQADARVRKVLGVEGRNSGSYRFLELSLVPWDYDLRGAEKISEELRAEICSQIDNVDEVLFDFAVEGSDRLVCAVPVEDGGTAVSTELAGVSAFEIFEMETPGGKAVSRRRLANTVEPGTPGCGARTAVLLARRGVELLLTREPDLDSAPYYVLDASGVRVLSRPATATVEEAVKVLSEFAAGYHPAGAASRARAMAPSTPERLPRPGGTM